MVYWDILGVSDAVIKFYSAVVEEGYEIGVWALYEVIPSPRPRINEVMIY